MKYNAALMILATFVSSHAFCQGPAGGPGATFPKVTHQVPPIYPFEIVKSGLEGSVMIGFVVNKEGDVRSPHIVQSNNPWFERPAIEALLKWRFEPGIQDGKPVNTRMRQRFSFRKDDIGRKPWRITKSRNHDQLAPELQWDRPPEVVNSAFPVYPFEQLRDKVDADFNAGLVVDTRGNVVLVKFQGSPPPEFAGAVRAMAAMWKFKPARDKDGKLCGALIVLEENFRADGGGTVPVCESAKEILKELSRPNPRIVPMGELDAPPKDWSYRKVFYPPELRDKKMEGEATIEFFIDRNGDAQLPRIVSCSQEEFGYYAALAASCWRYEPPLKNGKPVIVRAQRTVDFKIKN